MGGLITENKQNTSEGLPLLSRIPIIGGFFGNQTLKNTRTELVMFITPRVVENEVDLKASSTICDAGWSRSKGVSARRQAAAAAAAAAAPGPNRRAETRSGREGNTRKPSPISDSLDVLSDFAEKASLIPDISLLLTCNTLVSVSFGAERQLTIPRYFYSLDRGLERRRVVAVVVRSPSREWRLTLQRGTVLMNRHSETGRGERSGQRVLDWRCGSRVGGGSRLRYDGRRFDEGYAARGESGSRQGAVERPLGGADQG